MTKQELRSCPFCGGKASLIDLGYRDKPHRAIIRCDERYFSKCFLPESCYIAEGNEDIEQLINKWNTRASDVELEELKWIKQKIELRIKGLLVTMEDEFADTVAQIHNEQRREKIKILQELLK